MEVYWGREKEQFSAVLTLQNGLSGGQGKARVHTMEGVELYGQSTGTKGAKDYCCN